MATFRLPLRTDLHRFNGQFLRFLVDAAYSNWFFELGHDSEKSMIEAVHVWQSCHADAGETKAAGVMAETSAKGVSVEEDATMCVDRAPPVVAGDTGAATPHVVGMLWLADAVQVQSNREGWTNALYTLFAHPVEPPVHASGATTQRKSSEEMLHSQRRMRLEPSYRVQNLSLWRDLHFRNLSR